VLKHLEGWTYEELARALGASHAALGVDARASQAAPSASQLAVFARYIDALRERARIPGMSAAVVYQQRIVWEAGLGYQDLERRIVARPDTPYRIASLTKTFASTLLMGCLDRQGHGEIPGRHFVGNRSLGCRRTRSLDSFQRCPVPRPV